MAAAAASGGAGSSTPGSRIVGRLPDEVFSRIVGFLPLSDRITACSTGSTHETVRRSAMAERGKKALERAPAEIQELFEFCRKKVPISVISCSSNSGTGYPYPDFEKMKTRVSLVKDPKTGQLGLAFLVRSKTLLLSERTGEPYRDVSPIFLFERSKGSWLINLTSETLAYRTGYGSFCGVRRPDEENLRIIRQIVEGTNPDFDLIQFDPKDPYFD